jgi:glucokinase
VNGALCYDSAHNPTHAGGLTLSPRPVLALDLGGTQVRAAVVLPDGRRIARRAAPTPVADGAEVVLGTCISTLIAARADAPPDIGASIAAVGISAPGPLDPWTGTIGDAPNLGHGIHGLQIAAAIEAATGLPAYLDRDTIVAALAEQAFGAARGARHFLYLTVSTGIGGAIVIDGRPYHGPDGTAGELGHLPVELGTPDAPGPRCGCGGTGHLEAIASGIALAGAARTAAADGSSPFLAARAAESGLGPESLTARDVARAEGAGDPVGTALMDRARRAIAAACVAYVDLFNPERLIVGGSIAEGQGERLLGPIRDAIATTAFRAPARRVRVLSAELGPDVSLAGAQPLVASRIDDPAWRRGRRPMKIPAVA